MLHYFMEWGILIPWAHPSVQKMFGTSSTSLSLWVGFATDPVRLEPSLNTRTAILTQTQSQSIQYPLWREPAPKEASKEGATILRGSVPMRGIMLYLKDWLMSRFTVTSKMVVILNCGNPGDDWYPSRCPIPFWIFPNWPQSNYTLCDTEFYLMSFGTSPLLSPLILDYSFVLLLWDKEKSY